MCIIRLNRKLVTQLSIHRLDDLPKALAQSLERFGQLLLLVDTSCGQQSNPTRSQLLRQLGLNIAFIAQKCPALLLWQHIGGDITLICIGGRQLEIKYHAAQCNRQMQAIAKNTLCLETQ